jgi:hypothetical protein
MWLLAGIADRASGDRALLDSTSHGRERFALAPLTEAIFAVWCLAVVMPQEEDADRSARGLASLTRLASGTGERFPISRRPT